jgi:hypothetical protein
VTKKLSTSVLFFLLILMGCYGPIPTLSSPPYMPPTFAPHPTSKITPTSTITPTPKEKPTKTPEYYEVRVVIGDQVRLFNTETGETVIFIVHEEYHEVFTSDNPNGRVIPCGGDSGSGTWRVTFICDTNNTFIYYSYPWEEQK